MRRADGIRRLFQRAWWLAVWTIALVAIRVWLDSEIVPP
jgi:hypothetical protein